MEFRILGPLEVVGENGTLALGGSRQRALLTLLLTRPNEVVSADRLIDELWGQDVPHQAANALQYHVSQLRKTLAEKDRIRTRAPGYAIQVGPDELDLLRFERLVAEAENEAPDTAALLLRDALDLWRGEPLVDLANEPFVQTEIVRLEELRLRALELRIEADLALGRDAELVPELEVLVRENPLRERVRAALMRALYSAGRQAEALAAYRDARTTLVDELGIEPSPDLQELERAILRQDPALATGTDAPTRQRAIVVVVRDENRIDDLLAIAEPLARQPPRELIVARLVTSADELGTATATLADRRRVVTDGGVACRVAAYTTGAPGFDAALLATEHDSDLVLVDAARSDLESGLLDGELAVILTNAPCDVGVLIGDGRAASGPVVTPFGGAEHDWSAIELAAWLARALETTLRLVGTEADPTVGRRDASRLLARASMLVQQVVGIVTEPVLVPRGEAGVVAAARDARLLVVGLSERWRTEGLGSERASVAANSPAPTLFVRRGLRSGAVEPLHTLTRFTWTTAAPTGNSEL